MRQYQLVDIRLRCFQRADMVEGTPVDKNEANRLISEKYGELYSIAEAAGLRIVESEQSITATGAASYTIPTDHLATIDVEWVYDTAGHKRRLRRMNVQERSRWSGTTGDARVWELAGQQLFLYPVPATGTYKHLYLPQSPDLSTAADSTQIDVICPDGETFLIECVAAALKATKKEADVTYNVMQYEAARERAQAWCAMRAFTDSPAPGRDPSADSSPYDWWNPASFRWNPP